MGIYFSLSILKMLCLVLFFIIEILTPWYEGMHTRRIGGVVVDG